MKLIIDITEEDYEFTKGAKTARVFPSEHYVKLILNGVPLDRVKDKILNYNVRQHVSGSENFLKGYAVGMDKAAEILDKEVNNDNT